MKIYHVTNRSNLKSILKGGLDPKRAKGKRKAVWGVVVSRVEWALVHVLTKPWNKDATLADLVVIEISLPKANLRRYKSTIWFTKDVKSVPVTVDMVKPASSFGKVGS
jgi:hypothetical protein